jgi:hypothetical protein
MSIAKSDRPHISMERDVKGTTYIWLHMGDGKKLAWGEITAKPENAAVIDYFYERLKDGLDV